MKKTLRIIASIFLPLLINIIVIVIVFLSHNQCEYKLHHQGQILQDSYIFLFWTIIQLGVVYLIFIKSKYRKQLIAIPIISILFISLFAYWATDLINYEYRKFDKTEWNMENPFFKINYVEDIIENDRLSGLCYEELIEMLGNPNYKSKRKMEYDVGFGTMIIELKNNCYDKVEVICK